MPVWFRDGTNPGRLDVELHLRSASAASVDVPVRLRHGTDLEWDVLFLHLRRPVSRSGLPVWLFVRPDLEREQPVVELLMHRAAAGADLSVWLRLGAELGQSGVAVHLRQPHDADLPVRVSERPDLEPYDGIVQLRLQPSTDPERRDRV